jgi:hypothetical protein
MTIRDSGGDFDTLILGYAYGGSTIVDSPKFSTFDYVGNDLVLNLKYNASSQSVLSGTVTVVDFFTKQGEIEKFTFGSYGIYTETGAIEEPQYQIGKFGRWNQINGLKWIKLH